MSRDPTRIDHREPDARLSGAQERAPKPFLGLWFECAKVYGRAYRTPDGRAYLGKCPKCGASVRFGVGAEGSSDRFFKVRC